MKVKKLKIVGCSDNLMWYRNMVGQTVPLLREHDDCYMSREPDGYANIIKRNDAIIVEDENDQD